MKFQNWFALLILGLNATANSQVIDPYQVRFANVKVSVDSPTKGSRTFSGELRYDLESTYDSVPVHVYMENVPTKRTYMIYYTLGGHQPFMIIDSLCQGDLGWVKPGKNHLVRWTFTSTVNTSHSRLKVGLANYEYLLNDETRGQYQFKYAYNNTGQPVHRELKSSTQNLIVDYQYNSMGQTLFEPPYQWNRYDDRNRLIYSQQGTGATLHFIYGYAYDLQSRLSEVQMLPSGFSMEAPGPPFNREKYVVDQFNRLIYHEVREQTAPGAFSCNPNFIFNGISQSHTYYYQNAAGEKVDSTLAQNLDSSRSPSLMSQITTVNYRDRDSVLIRTFESSQGFDTAAGSCDAPNYDQQTVSIYSYQSNSFGTIEKTVTSRKKALETSFTVIDSSCGKSEYDNLGRPVRKYQGCANILAERIEYDPYGFLKVWEFPNTSITNYNRKLFNLDSLEALHAP